VVAVGHPFDTLKVRLQTQDAAKPIYDGMVDCARKTVQWEGPGGLYKGVTSPLVGQMFFRASMFSAFGASKRWLADRRGGEASSLTTADFFAAGAMTGFAAAFTESPIDFFKSQIQYQILREKADPAFRPAFTGLGGAVREAIRANGLRGPFQGFQATMLRNVPANSLYLGFFETSKRFWADRLGCARPADLPAPYVLGSAAAGGLLYWITIYPVDVVKSALMTDAMPRGDRKYAGMADAASKLWAEGGLKRFYVGFAPCLIRAAPANATMLYTVDKITHLLADR